IMTDPDAGARAALRLIGPDPANWVPDREGIDHNVMVVGGGQTGCAFAFAMRRAGIGKVSVIDAAAEPERAGIWTTGARMHVLRTPKTLPGPARRPTPRSSVPRAKRGSSTSRGTAIFSASRCVTARGSNASSRPTAVS